MTLHSNIDISIIIVNYKTPQLLYNCIESIENNKSGLNIEIIVVDNDSKDASETLIKTNFPEVLWINIGYNSGFSRANNAGIKRAKGKYLLLLNSDTVIINDCLTKSLDYYKNIEKQNCKVGLLGCKMKDLNEQILFNSNSYFPGIKKIIKANPFYIWFTRKKQKITEDTTTERTKHHCKNHNSAWIGLAFAICNRNVVDVEKLYLDEDFFMYCEDVEWCYRLAKKGYKHFFYSEAEIYHINCGSSGFSEWKTAQVFISEWLYIYKSRGFLYYQIYILLIKFQLFVDNILYLKSLRKNKISDDDLVSLNHRTLIKTLLKKYGFAITRNYYKKPSSGKEFLKYHA